MCKEFFSFPEFGKDQPQLVFFESFNKTSTVVKLLVNIYLRCSMMLYANPLSILILVLLFEIIIMYK